MMPKEVTVKRTLVLILAAGTIVFLACKKGDTGQAAAQPMTAQVSAAADAPSAATPDAPPVDQSADKGIGPIDNLTLGPIDNGLAEKGRGIFETRCAVCHGLDRDKTGPALGDVLKEARPEFVMNFLLNTAEMEQKDPKIKKLIDKFGMPMPPMGLDKDQARAVVEYFRTTQKTPRP
jgi:mono/diheme cytochrome c family protein